MDQILDDTKETRNEKRTFSILSLLTVVINILLIIVFNIILTRVMNAFPRNVSMLTSSVVILAIIFTVLGLIFSILSFYRKEPSTWIKWVGMVINVIVFVIFAGGVVVAFLVVTYY